MKNTHLFGILVIAVGIALLISLSGDMSTYSTFSDAQTGERVKLVGTLVKEREMVYNPDKDPNYFSFYIQDNNGDQGKVVLLSEKPQDFERSESIVLTGAMKDDAFVATEMLMKCPSKYKDEEILIRSKSGKL